MKKIINTVLFSALIFAGSFSLVMAENVLFNVSLGAGSSQKTEVVKLQNFLIESGYLNASPIGIFGPLTTKAVMQFQKDNGVMVTGYFGPLTRAVANSKSGGMAQSATIQTVSAGNSNTNTASIILSKEKVVKWQTNGYPAGVGVNINLLRKVLSSPDSFVFVRNIATDTANDGSETWIPNAGESGNDLYVEVVCSSNYQFKTGCKLGGAPMKVN